MDDYCYAEMATSGKREHERQSPTGKKWKDEDVQQKIGHSEELPSQKVSSTLMQETPQPPRIKKEEEELWITQEGECLLGPQEADYTKFPPTVVSVKTEDDEEKPQVDNFLAPLSDTEVEEPSNSDTNCGSDMTTQTGTKPSECSKIRRDIQQLIGLPEELPPQSGGSSTLTQDTPQPPHIKREEEEFWITRERESLLGSKEADLTKLPLTIVSVKTENDEEKPQEDNLQAPLSDSEAEDEVEVTLSSDADCAGDMRTQADNKHSKKKRGKKLFSCSVCAKSFNRDRDLTQHMRTHTGEKPFDCSVCGKRFSQKGNLSLHMRTHTSEKPFCCSVCGKRFTRKGNWSQHMRTHSGEKTFNCSVCGKSFYYKSNLTKHLKTHPGDKVLNCSVCGKSFSHESNLFLHMRTHTGESAFNCSDCGKSFSYKSNLTLHMRKHTEGKTFNCPACDKSFYLKGNLAQHMRTHTGEKPFNCSVCDKNFSHKSSLTLHTRTHTGEKPFDCSVCCKNFSQKKRLTEHMRTHTGEKPFSCSVCGKGFYYNAHAVRHKRTHKGE